MSLLLLPSENLINIFDYLDYDGISNLRLVSRKLNTNIKYFINKKVKNIKNSLNELNDKENLLKFKDFSDFIYKIYFGI